MSRTRTKRTSDLRIDELFSLIRGRGLVLVPQLSRFKIARCALADGEHRKSHRQYMHMNHHQDTICYAAATKNLEIEWQIGLLAHELGHAVAFLVGQEKKHTEEDANRLGGKILGSAVIFKGPESLEWARVPRWLEEACADGRRSGKGSSVRR